MTENARSQMVCPNPEMFPLIWSHFRAHDIPDKRHFVILPLTRQNRLTVLGHEIDQLFDSSEKQLARTLLLLARCSKYESPIRMGGYSPGSGGTSCSRSLR